MAMAAPTQAAAVEMATVLDAEAMAKFPKLVALGAAVGTSTAIKVWLTDL